MFNGGQILFYSHRKNITQFGCQVGKLAPILFWDSQQPRNDACGERLRKFAHELATAAFAKAVDQLVGEFGEIAGQGFNDS